MATAANARRALERVTSELARSTFASSSAFASKTTSELVQGYFVLAACRYVAPSLVERALPIIPTALFSPFFKHFVAGESEQEIRPVIERLRREGMDAILDYAAEAQTSNAGTSEGIVAIEQNLERMKHAIQTVRSPMGFAALKVTALGKPEDLEIASAKIRAGAGASDSRAELEPFFGRLSSLASLAQSSGVGLLIDAEAWQYQEAIRQLQKQLQREFNKDGALILGTYQCYLKESKAQLLADLAESEREGYCFGAKLVRGAYLSLERQRALEMGYDCPILPSREATTRNFDACVNLLLRKIKDDSRTSLMVATHNRKSILRTIQTMDSLGISSMKEQWDQPEGASFAQLLGMTDSVSSTLGSMGQSTYKYLPYGPREEVLPYLIRRAHENREVLSRVDEEMELMLREIAKRVKNSVSFL